MPLYFAIFSARRQGRTAVKWVWLIPRHAWFQLLDFASLRTLSALQSSRTFLEARTGREALPLQRRTHVALVTFHTGLTVRVDAHQPSFNNSGEHQHLQQLSQRVLREGRDDQVRGRSGRLAVSLVRPLEGRVQKVRKGFARQRVQ